MMSIILRLDKTYCLSFAILFFLLFVNLNFEPLKYKIIFDGSFRP